jgi:hypothetical protein
MKAAASASLPRCLETCCGINKWFVNSFICEQDWVAAGNSNTKSEPPRHLQHHSMQHYQQHLQQPVARAKADAVEVAAS